jgi:hypothetical protein
MSSIWLRDRLKLGMGGCGELRNALSCSGRARSAMVGKGGAGASR